MGFLFLFGLLTLFGIILALYGSRRDYDGYVVVGVVTSIIGGIVLFVMLIEAATLPSDFDYTEEEYINLSMQIGTVDRDDIVTGENLRNQVLEMNNKISKHKCYSKNLWVGMFWSERIGALEPLEVPHSNRSED